jgi:pyridoxine kinase
MSKIEAKWIELGIKFDAFYTGYVCESHIDHILSIMKTCGRPGATRIVDPAMADDGELYRGFAADFPTKIARLCDGADYMLPNMTEAALLVGEKPVLSGHTCEYVESLVSRLHALGAKNVVLTGVSFEHDMLGTAVSDGGKVEYDFNPRLTRTSHGTGDIFASVFSAAVLRGKTAAEAAALAADIVCLAIESTEPDHLYGVSFENAIPSLVKAFSA